MGSINFAAPFQFLRSIATAPQYGQQQYDMLGALAQMQPMPQPPQLAPDPNYLWVRKKSDGQLALVLPGDFDPTKHDKSVVKP